jgi:LPS-assembly protein
MRHDQAVDMVSDVANYDDKTSKAELSGDVKIVRGSQHLRAEQVHYSAVDGVAQARGGVDFSDDGLRIEGPWAEVHFNDDTAEFTQATYQYAPRHARGQAQRVYRESPQVIKLKEATYTTCNAGRSDWLISADKIKLDRNSGDGTARNVVLRIKNFPVLYSPWFPFLIDDRRKSGFLAPSFGSVSTSGFVIAVPYYWNMAPNRDLLFTPHFLSKRGLQLNSTFRYLQSSHRGGLTLEYIDDKRKNDDRYLISFADNGHFIPRLTTYIDYNKVSDSEYLEDFGNSLSQTSISHLPRQAHIRYSGDFWSLLTRVQTFQTIDLSIPPLSRPYAQMPQVLFDSHLPDQRFGLGYGLRAEWVRFDRNAGVNADRFRTILSVDRPYLQPGFYLKPNASLWFSKYSLGNLDTEDMETAPSLTVPIFSLDSGLIFERGLSNGHLLQTLEPQLYYLYVPYKNQDEAPTFDTAELDFNFLRLFRYNRFVGGDRIGDANQLTLALTSRFIDADSGREIFSASLGNIFYFRNRKVTLPTRSTEETNNSDIVGELYFGINDHWTARGTTLFDPHNGEQQRATASLRYRAGDNRIVNIGYNFLRDDLDQTDFAFAWPLGTHWELFGRWNYDLDSRRNLEVLGGIEYETCCWKVRAVAGQFVNNADGDFTNTFQVQFVLKGLAALGTGSVDKMLERSILGYRVED